MGLRNEFDVTAFLNSDLLYRFLHVLIMSMHIFTQGIFQYHKHFVNRLFSSSLWDVLQSKGIYSLTTVWIGNSVTQLARFANVHHIQCDTLLNKFMLIT